MEETWEIDVEQLTLNDLEVLEKGLERGSSAAQIKNVLGRLVTNKTAEEIGAMPLGELRRHLARLAETITELSVPKANAAP